MNAPTRFAALALTLAALMNGCDETDLVAVRLWVEPDLSGRLATSSVSIPEPGRPPAVRAAGVAWKERLDVASAVGDFGSLAELQVEDIVFRAGQAGERLVWIEVELPRGPDARWPRALVPLSQDERRGVAQAVDPSGRLKEVGGTVKLEIHLPSRVIGHGMNTRPRGAKEKAEGEIATLLVPIERALVDEEPLLWHVTWERAE
jgi:hypothetical protein